MYPPKNQQRTQNCYIMNIYILYTERTWSNIFAISTNIKPPHFDDSLSVIFCTRWYCQMNTKTTNLTAAKQTHKIHIIYIKIFIHMSAHMRWTTPAYQKWWINLQSFIDEYTLEFTLPIPDWLFFYTFCCGLVFFRLLLLLLLWEHIIVSNGMGKS